MRVSCAHYSIDQALIQKNRIATNSFAREFLLDQFAARLAKSAPKISVGGQALDGSGERFHLSERDQVGP